MDSPRLTKEQADKVETWLFPCVVNLHRLAMSLKVGGSTIENPYLQQALEALRAAK